MNTGRTPPASGRAGDYLSAPSPRPVIYRVQDVEGRGPYRPGFSHRWVEDEGPRMNAPWYVELGLSVSEAVREMPPGYHYGCGFTSMRQFHDWFTPRELKRLHRFGYALVEVMPDIIIAETDTQVVFGTKWPLAKATPRIRLTSKKLRSDFNHPSHGGDCA